MKKWLKRQSMTARLQWRNHLISGIGCQPGCGG